MTTQPVPSITDDQIAEIEALAVKTHESTADLFAYGNAITPSKFLALISRLRAAEKDAGRMQWMEDAWGGHSGRDGGFHVAIYMPQEADSLREMIDLAKTGEKP